jgi:hypothetical protein
MGTWFVYFLYTKQFMGGQNVRLHRLAFYQSLRIHGLKQHCTLPMIMTRHQEDLTSRND